MSEHTPAPWETCGVRCKVDGQPFLQVNGPNGYVALIPYSDRKPADHLQSHADQRLIATAPMMLAALQGYIGLFDTMANGLEVLPAEMAHARSVMRAAISTATGAAP